MAVTDKRTVMSSSTGIDFKKTKLDIQPQVLARLLQLNERSDMNFVQLDHLIKSDQNMAALILKAANSALYSRGHEVRSLQIAISLLGFNVVKSLCIAAGARSIFKVGDYSRFHRYVWHHSIVTAVIAKHLAGLLGHKQREEEAFVAGLLHDLGKVILNALDRKKFIDVIQKATSEGVPFAAAEKAVFGFTHMDIAVQAVSEWGMPEIYKSVAGMHSGMDKHDLSGLNGEDRTLLLLVAHANYLAKRYGYGHHAQADDDDGAFLEAAFGLSDSSRVHLYEEYPKILPNDEFYKFFHALV